MSGKPVHKGHMMAIQQAANECDEVMVFVSLVDRKKPGEVPIFGSDMELIWKTQLEGIMPSNVKISYVRVPVRSAYEFADKVEKSGKSSMVFFYSDQEDLDSNFSDKSMEKYFPRLTSLGLIEKHPTKRFFSGTKMRELLAANKAKEFKNMLPDGVDKEMIWDILKSSAGIDIT